jgi:hypothetical protein
MCSLQAMPAHKEAMSTVAGDINSKKVALTATSLNGAKDT